MRGTILPLFALLLLVIPTAVMAGQHPFKKHPGCQRPGHTCVLKYVDGAPFYCLRTVASRLKNTRLNPRKVTHVNDCIARFPAIPVGEKKQEE